MKRELKGRRLLITGASSGIGRALAEQAADRGARIILVARTADKLNEQVCALAARGAEALAVPADITLDADRERLLQTVQERFGGLDVLINNAGIGAFGHFADATESELRQIMETNFFAPAELIRRAVPILTEGTQPAILNVCSMCGRRAVPSWSEYCASKFALSGLTEALRAELVRFGIDVLMVVPGLTRTDLNRKLLRNSGRYKIKYDRGMPPEDVARTILWALEKNRAETVIGRDAKWMLRVNRWMPWFVDWQLARLVRKLWPRTVDRRP